MAKKKPVKKVKTSKSPYQPQLIFFTLVIAIVAAVGAYFITKSSAATKNWQPVSYTANHEVYAWACMGKNYTISTKVNHKNGGKYLHTSVLVTTTEGMQTTIRFPSGTYFGNVSYALTSKYLNIKTDNTSLNVPVSGGALIGNLRPC